jgi:sec-independent protein translocase protein TatA
MFTVPAQQMVHSLALGMPMGAEWLVIGALGLLIFGKRLPEVGKGIGSAIRSFKKGLNEAENEPLEEDVPVAKRLTDSSADAGKIEHQFDPYTGKPIEKPQPKFDPYTGKALTEDVAVAQA